MTILLEKLREAGAYDDLLFNVESQDIVTSGGHKILGKKAIVKPDGGVVGIVSDKYKILTNYDVVTHMSEALEASGLDLEGITVNPLVGYGGSRAMVKIVLPSHQIAMKEDKSDKASLSITVLNSYDGKWKFRSYAGALRHACLNGQIFGSFMGAYSDYHTQRLDVKAGAAHLMHMAENFHKAEDWYSQMQNRKVDREQLLRSLAIFFTGQSKVDDREAFLAKPTVSKLVGLFETYSKEFGTNALALYNAMTDYVTHAKYNGRTKAGMLLLNEEKLAETMNRQKAAFAFEE